MLLSQRCRKRWTDAALIRSWRAQDASWAVEEVQSLYGLPTLYIVVRTIHNGNQEIVSRHRRKSAAVRELERRLRRSPR